MAGSASALYLLDIKGHVLVWRDYRGDVSAVQAERFFTKLIEKEGDPGSQYPVAYNNGVTYLFVQHSNGYPMTASRQNCNAASLLAFFSFCTARLIGMLECKLGLNDRVLLETQGRSSKGKPLIWMISSFISVCVWHDLKMIGQ